MNLNYIIIYVKNFEESKAFYRDKLGMTVIDGVSSAIFATLRPENGAMIGLQDAASSQLPPGRETQPGSVELSFEFEDVRAAYEQWKANGVEMLSEVLELPFGLYFLAKDNEGHYLSGYRFNQR